MSDFGVGPDTIRLGDLEVRRLGFGAMRLPGPEVWGEPADPARAKRVLTRAIELGINFIDTSWYYGPFVANRLIAEALHPYPRDLVIATKLGGKRLENKGWGAFSKPAEIKEGLEHDLRTLKRDVIDVVHFRFIPMGGVPFADSLGALMDEKKAGRVRHIALSNVGPKELAQGLAMTEIVAVQNLFNIAGGSGQLAKMAHAEVEEPEAVLETCAAKGIAFLPFFPLAVGGLGKGHSALADAAKKHGATPAQIAIAWLLARSPVMLPIPGTGSPEHLEENWEARKIALSADEVRAISEMARAV
jgi:pyridoxine 4-dehydrogenase